MYSACRTVAKSEKETGPNYLNYLPILVVHVCSFYSFTRQFDFVYIAFTKARGLPDGGESSGLWPRSSCPRDGSRVLCTPNINIFVCPRSV